ncbi:MAG: glycosyl hydrolase family 2 [Acidobacteriia bacterium]|nr:glycosyl hydrolase family 2 [Terriglobia bacterium]
MHPLMAVPAHRKKSIRWGILLPAVLAATLALLPAPARGNDEIALRENWAIQSSAKVDASAEQISRAGFAASGWCKTSLPKTVFAALVENGVHPDPYFGKNLRSLPGVTYEIGSEFSNQEMPEDSPFAKPWWYRTEFDLPASYAGKIVRIAFRGINYRAEIWINGQKVAGEDQIAGAFRRYDLNVTRYVRAGEKNALAVKVSAPKAGELGITWVDWNPTPPDKDMGLWQEVVVSASGPVSVRHPFVETKLDLPAAATARLTVRVAVRNDSAAAVTGTLRGKILGEKKPIEFTQAVALAPGESRTITLSPDTVAALLVAQPRLWWPYTMGQPYLHTLVLDFLTADGAVSDTQRIEFGIVQHDSQMTAEGHRLFRVNGKPVLIRGGGWAPDMLLRVDAKRRAAEFRYVKGMGLNTIRLEGKLEDEDFFAFADREGILVMAGWCCCDAWEKWGAWNDENRLVSVESLRDQALRLRRHPSVFVWLNGSDNPPPADRERAYLDVLQQVNWPYSVVSSATAKPTDVTGPSGVKMTGPYDYVPPNYWLLDTKTGGAHGFNTETSPGPAVPPLESLRKMMPADQLWPINDTWNFHAGGGVFKDIKLYTNALEQRYGQACDASDFAWKSQAVAYEGQRAMFEAFARNKYRSTGVIQWMLNNAWPGLIWHLYDYYLRPGGGYFGSKKALEPVHVQFSYDDRSVAVVSDRQAPLAGLRVEARLYDMEMKERFASEAVVDVPADGVVRAFAVPEPASISTTYFLTLRLLTPAGKLLSRNFYWLSTKPDILDWAKGEWYYTPQTAFADFTALQNLPKVAVKASLAKQESGTESLADVTLQNTGKTLAYLVRLRLLRGPGGEEVLPVFWEDNYFSLLPGEKRTIAVRYRTSDAGGAPPVLAVDGWNVIAAH